MRARPICVQLRPRLRGHAEMIPHDNGETNGCARACGGMRGSIPPNLIALPNTESNSQYIKYCTENGLPVHPARFPGTLPEYFIRLCTDEHDLVVDPFGGSCVTGEVAEKLNRRWCCCDTVEEYIKGAVGRFKSTSGIPLESSEVPYYIYKPGYLWDSIPEDTLDPMGGKRRVAQRDSKE